MKQKKIAVQNWLHVNVVASNLTLNFNTSVTDRPVVEYASSIVVNFAQ